MRRRGWFSIATNQTGQFYCGHKINIIYSVMFKNAIQLNCCSGLLTKVKAVFIHLIPRLLFRAPRSFSNLQADLHNMADIDEYK